MKTIGKAMGRAALSVILGVAVVGGGLYVAGLASASNRSPWSLAAVSPEPTGNGETTTTADAPARPGLLKGALHADITALYVDGSTRTFTADRGRIKSVDGGTIVLEQPGGTTVSAPTNESTCIRKDGQPAALSDLEVGARAGVLQENGLAVAVRSGRPERGADREPCGIFKTAVHAEAHVTFLDGSTRDLTYDRGQITAITDTQITLMRRDGQSVTLNYDDSTMVRENGQTESVGDLTVGERAMFFAEGGLAKLIRCVSTAPAA
jgi:hypothetical protein